MTTVLPLYRHERPDVSGTMHVETVDDVPPRGEWVLLVELAQCPNGCVGGEVWGGDDLARCHVCNGDSTVPVGVGGGLVWQVQTVSIPEEPTETMCLVVLRNCVMGESCKADG